MAERRAVIVARRAVTVAHRLWQARRHLRPTVALAVEAMLDESEPRDEPVVVEPVCRAGWWLPFTCDRCQKRQEAVVDDHVRQVEVIKWAGEYDDRFRWVLRFWCDQCWEPTMLPVSDVTARRVFTLYGVPVEDMWAPSVSDDVVAGLLGGGR